MKKTELKKIIECLEFIFFILLWLRIFDVITISWSIILFPTLVKIIVRLIFRIKNKKESV